MARPSDQINIRLINKVSLLYYNDELTQQEIARRLNLSRPKVSRLLKQARELGIVKITVETASGSYIEQEIGLEKKFGLKEAIIIDSVHSSTAMYAHSLKQQLGRAASIYLQRTVTDKDIIGVTWGSTLSAMIESMTPTPTKGVTAVQMLGGVGPPEAKEHAIDITRRLAQLLSGRPALLQAPGVVTSPEARDVLLADGRVREVLNLYPSINIAFVGIGALSTNLVLQKESPEISSENQLEILSSDAVGDIGLNFFDQNGSIVETHLQDLFIGMSLEQIKEIQTVVGIAGGEDKFEAILGALKGKYINVLITDLDTAGKLSAI